MCTARRRVHERTQIVTSGRRAEGINAGPPMVQPAEERDIEEREYDLSSRHLLTARILRRVAPAGPVLDVGGSLGLTQLV